MKRIALIGLAGLVAGSALAGTATLTIGAGTATITRTAGSTATIVDAPAAPTTSAAPAPQDTTHVRNGNSSATITQSGDPARTTRQVERWDGHTRIEQRNGSNASVITQDGPGSPSPLDDDPFFRDDK